MGRRTWVMSAVRASGTRISKNSLGASSVELTAVTTSLSFARDIAVENMRNSSCRTARTRSLMRTC